MAFVQKTPQKVKVSKPEKRMDFGLKEKTFKKSLKKAQEAKANDQMTNDKNPIEEKSLEDQVRNQDKNNGLKAVDSEKSTKRVKDVYDDLSKDEKEAVEALKELLKTLDIKVSDETLLELAQAFDFSNILDSLKMLVESQNILETSMVLLDNLSDLEALLNDLSDQLVGQTVEKSLSSDVKEKFDALLEKLNGHMEEIKVSSDMKTQEKAIKDLLTLMKKTFNEPTLKKNIKAQNTLGHESALNQSNPSESKIAIDDQKSSLQMEDSEMSTEDVKIKVDTETTDKNSNNNNQSFNQETNNVVLTDENQLVVNEETIKNQVDFKEELNFRLLSKTEQTAKVFSQIKEGFTTKLDGKISEMKVLLDPKSLGKVELKLTIEKGNVLAEFEVESMVVKQAIESNLQDLRNALSDKGYNLDALNVNVGGDSEENQESNEGFYENIFSELDEEENAEQPDLLVEESRLLSMMKRRAVSYLG